MTDKERLKEIEKNLNPLGYGMGGHLISVNDIYWLVKYAKEQAERAQELENENRILRTVTESNKYIGEQYLEQSKRYREALKEISQKRITYADMAGALRIAREALEGTE